MMLILSHIHSENNFPVIYRARKASFSDCLDSQWNISLELFTEDKVYNILAYITFCPRFSSRGAHLNLYTFMKNIIHLFFASLSFTELPHSPPTLWTEFTKYDPGDILRANCSTQPSKPSAALTFLLNQYAVSKAFNEVVVSFNKSFQETSPTFS